MTKLPGNLWWDGDRLARIKPPVAAAHLKILYEDNHVLSVFKPAGLLSQGPGEKQNTLVDIAKEWIKIKYEKPGNVYLGLVHRLDRPVSGVVILAKTSKAASRLSAQMREKQIHKEYLAVVHGIPKNKKGTVEGYLKKNEKDQKMLIIDSEYTNSLYSRLEYKLLDSKGYKSLLLVFPFSGRRHQIRVLLAHVGLPIWGDCKYGKGPKLRSTIGLLAYRMSFLHPTTFSRITVEAPLPPNWPWP